MRTAGAENVVHDPVQCDRLKAGKYQLQLLPYLLILYQSVFYSCPTQIQSQLCHSEDMITEFNIPLSPDQVVEDVTSNHGLCSHEKLQKLNSELTHATSSKNV